MKKYVKQCPNCDTINYAWHETCCSCGVDIKSVVSTEMAIDSDYKNEPPKAAGFNPAPAFNKTSRFNGSSLTRICAVIIGVIGFIFGIVCGNVFSGTRLMGVVFNTVLMFSVWISTLVVVLPFILAYYHFKNQESANDLLEKIANSLDANK